HRGRPTARLFTDIDKLREIAKKGLSDIAANGPDAEQFDKTVKNLEKKIPESKLRVSYWQSCIEDNLLYGIDYINEYEAAVKALTPEKVKAVAAELCEGYFSELVMRPEE
ncbi:MAG: hypothetical protein MJY42_04110, partial [Bacteroidales bacterium]|nr:hypothetical protein [Bacteroidales bacterium]